MLIYVFLLPEVLITHSLELLIELLSEFSDSIFIQGTLLYFSGNKIFIYFKVMDSCIKFSFLNCLKVIILFKHDQESPLRFETMVNLCYFTLCDSQENKGGIL